MAQQLLDRAAGQPGIGAQRGQLGGVAQQRERAEAEHVGRGLVAGDEQHHGDAGHLGVIQPGVIQPGAVQPSGIQPSAVSYTPSPAASAAGPAARLSMALACRSKVSCCS